MTTVVAPTDSAPPRRKLRRLAHTVAEVEWFLEWTTDNSYAVARALGVQRESLERAVLTRAGRVDLWARLTARDVSLEPEPWHAIHWLPESDPRRRTAERNRLEREAARRSRGVPMRVRRTPSDA